VRYGILSSAGQSQLYIIYMGSGRLLLIGISFCVLLTGLLFMAPESSQAQPVNPKSAYEQRLEQGIDAFYRSDWQRASTIFRQLQQLEPNNPRAWFFESMVPFWQYFFGGGDTKLAKDFLKSSDKALQVAEKRLKAAPRDTSVVFILSGLHGYRSLVAAAEKEYTTAVKSGVTGFSYTRQLLSFDDSNEDALIGKGVFNYMMGSVPREGRWMTGMMGMSGDIQVGFQELERAANSKSASKTEAMMILAYLYDREKMHDDALRVSRKLVDAYPENIIFQYYLARSLDNTKQLTEATDVYKRVVEMDSDLQGLKDTSNVRLRELSR
jgi:tetratricopeptide (TPR) repeat protein